MDAKSLTWSPEPFMELHGQLFTPDDIPTSVLASVLLEILPDLQNLLNVPPKNDESRKAVSLGKLKISNIEYELNAEFVAECCQLADELGIDEKIAAEFLQYGAQQQIRLDRKPLQCAMICFHLRRQYLLEVVRLVLLNATNTSLKSSVIFQNTAKKLITPSFITSIIAYMDSMKSELRTLQEKEASGHFLGRDLDESFVESINQRRESILKEHESIAQILVQLSKTTTITVDFIKKLLDQALSIERYDQIMIHYIPVIIAFISSFSQSPSDDSSSSEAQRVFDDAMTIQSYIAENRRKPSSKLPFFHAAIHLWWYIYFSGFCSRERELASAPNISLDYTKDIFRPALACIINSGAMEFMMILAADTSSDPEFGTTHTELRNMLLSKTLQPVNAFQDPQAQPVSQPLELESIVEMSESFQDILFQHLSDIASSLVSNMADILKELRSKEEELLIGDDISEAEADGHQNDDDDIHLGAVEFDLERFFMFVSYLFSDRLNGFMEYWSDMESDFYGFLIWASQCQTPLMIATYCDMLASLSLGSDSSLCAHIFLKDEDGGVSGVGIATSNAIVRDRKMYRISWEYMFEAFQYYIAQLQSFRTGQDFLGNSSSANALPSRALIAIDELPELDDDDCVVLSSYLRLFDCVASWCPQARNDLTGVNAGINAFDLLFNLLSCRTPLTGPLLNTIKAFAADAPRPVCDVVWAALDGWLLHQPIIVSRTPQGLGGGYSRNLSLKDRFQLLLTTYPDVYGFVSLIECLTRIRSVDNISDLPFPETLGANYRAPGIKPYVDLIVDEIFCSTTAVEFTTKQRLALQISCMKFMRNCIQNFNTNLISLALSNNADVGSGAVNIDSVLQPSGLAAYIRMHPCVWMMEKLFDERVYGVIFSIAAIGIDAINGQNLYKYRTVQAVALSLQIIYRVLEIEEIYIDVLQPNSKIDDISSGRGALAGSGNKSVTGSPRALLGMKNFEDAILFNMYIITHVALYVNSEHVSVASLAIKILDRIARAPQFLNLDYDVPVPGAYSTGIKVSDISLKSTKIFGSGVDVAHRIGVNRLLSALYSVDESRRIIFGFIEQLERNSGDYADPEDPSLDDFTEDESESAINGLKLEILQFLSRNLSTTTSQSTNAADFDSDAPSPLPTVAHFLLGFKIGDGSTAVGTSSLESYDDIGGIGSPVSLFKCIVNILEDAVSHSGPSGGLTSFTKAAASIVSEASNIIYKLCFGSISSSLVLKILRSSEYSFFTSRISEEPLVTTHTTRFESRTFRELFLTNESIYIDQPDLAVAEQVEQEEREVASALQQFLYARTFLLEYCAIELHDVHAPASSLFEKYMAQLTSIGSAEDEDKDDIILSIERAPFAGDTAKTIELLDFMEFDIEKLAAKWSILGNNGYGENLTSVISGASQLNTDDSQKLFGIKDVDYFTDLKIDRLCMFALPTARSDDSQFMSPDAAELLYDIDRVEELLELKVREMVKAGKLLVPVSDLVLRQIKLIVHRCHRYNSIVCLRRAQSRCLAAWCKLVRIMLVDSKDSNISEPDTFILETMQILAPKLLAYAHVWESRVAEHLASVAVGLISVKQNIFGLEDSKILLKEEMDDGSDIAASISHTMLRVALVAVQSPYASPSVRSDLYTLINIFICNHPTHHRKKLTQLQRTILSCANGPGQKGPILKDQRENRLIERIATDAVSGEGSTRIMAIMVLRAFAAVENVTGDLFVLEALVRYNLLLLLVRSIRRIDEDLDVQNCVSNYEITAFKSVVILLTELAQTRTGAAQIIQAGLFSVLQNVTFLDVDPDIGIFTISSMPMSMNGSGLNGFAAGSSGRNVYFQLLAVILRLVACCAVSMGHRNVSVSRLVREILNKRLLVIRAVLRRVVNRDLSTIHKTEKNDDEATALAEAGQLVVLLASLSGLTDNESQDLTPGLIRQKPL
ncbi:nucleoporin Nup186/Nup192/Nup205 [Dipodascopsis uninucleata]